MPVCEKCGKTIQPGARVCIYCGEPVKMSQVAVKPVEKPQNRKPMVILGCVVAVVAIIFFVLMGTRSGNKATAPDREDLGGFSYQIVIPCTDLVVDQQLELIGENTTGRLKWHAEPEGTTDTVTFTSKDTSIAVVDQDGMVTAVGNGRTTIVITCGPVERHCEVVCNITGMVPEIKLKFTDATFNNKGYSWVAYEDNTDPALFVWLSDNESIARVDNGVVTGVGPGVTTIYALYNGEVVASCIIRNKW